MGVDEFVDGYRCRCSSRDDRYSSLLFGSFICVVLIMKINFVFRQSIINNNDNNNKKENRINTEYSKEKKQINKQLNFNLLV